MLVNNKTHIIITGGASGIGLEITKALVQKEAKVSILDINDLKIDKSTDLYEKIIKIKCDITNYAAVNKALKHIFEINGPVDILINSAGIITNSPIYNITKRNDKRHSLKLWRQTIDTNLNGVFNVSSFVIENMIENRKQGVIINISSICANGNIGQSAYSASKAGVESLTKVWAKELGPNGIRTACIAPGFCDTESTHNSMDEQKVRQWINKTPLKRLGTKKEIIETINFIITNDYFNGKILAIDGGLFI